MELMQHRAAMTITYARDFSEVLLGKSFIKNWVWNLHNNGSGIGNIVIFLNLLKANLR